MRALVTGGCGFIGTNLVNRLQRDGWDVTVFDDFSTSKPAEPRPPHVQYGCVEHYHEVLDAYMRPSCPDVVFHLAALNIVLSLNDPARSFAVNLRGIVNLLEAIRESARRAGAHKEMARIVYASSSSVYGNARYIPAHEDDATHVLSPYAGSKLAAEHACFAWHVSYGVPVAILRLSNVYGPHQSVKNPYCGVAAKLFAAATAGAPMQIHGDGEQSRDYTYVDDVVEAFMRAATSPRAIGRLYNVGTGRETSVNALADLIASTVGGPPVPRQHVPSRDIDNIRRRCLHIDRARHDLGWTPTVTLADGLARTWAWLEA